MQGTPPFVSCHLQWTPTHTAIHDIESFWWVLLYVALEYSGPGKIREAPKEVRDFVEALYQLGAASSKRKKIFTDKGIREALSHIDPYFACLEDLIRKWHTFLSQIFLTQESIEYNYPHHVVINFVQEAIRNCDDYEVSSNDDNHEERILDDATKAILSQKTVHAILGDTRDLEPQKISQASSLMQDTSSTPLLSPENVSGSTLHSPATQTSPRRKKSKTRVSTS
jgi:hypothetical protein